MIVNYGVAQYVNMETIIDTHMNSCNRSAMILPRDMAIQLYTTLKRDKPPVFFGRDVIIETLWGYKYEGYFPTNVFHKGRYLSQTGIVEWWQQYFDFSIVQKTSTNFKGSTLKLKKSCSSQIAKQPLQFSFSFQVVVFYSHCFLIFCLIVISGRGVAMFQTSSKLSKTIAEILKVGTISGIM